MNFIYFDIFQVLFNELVSQLIHKLENHEFRLYIQTLTQSSIQNADIVLV